MSKLGRTPGGMLRLTALAVIALGLPALLYLPALGQEYLKQSFVAASEARPIHLNADAVSTWTEQGRRVVLLKGRVWIGQGLTVLNAPAAVVFIDETRRERTGIYYVDVYAESDVQVSDGMRKKSASKAIVQLSTRGDVRMKSYESKVSQTRLPNDAVYRTGVREIHIAIGPQIPETQQVAPKPNGSSEPVNAANSVASTAPPRFVPPTGVSDLRDALHELPPGYAREPLRTDAGVRQTAFDSSSANPPPPNFPESPSPGAGSSTLNAPAPDEIELPAVEPTLGQNARKAEYGTPAMLPPLDDVPPPSLPPAQNTTTQKPDVPATLPPVPPFPTAEFSPGSSKAPPGPVEFQPPPPTPSGPRTITTQQPGITTLPPAVPPQPRNPIMGGINATTPGDNPRRVSIRPRSGTQIQIRNFPQPDGSNAVVAVNGIILTISDPTNAENIIDIEADRLVFWTNGDSRQLFDGMRGGGGDTTQTLEFYMAGNVELRSRLEGESQTLRANEIYYDVNRSVAVATQADLEIRQERLPNPLHVKADEVLQINATLFQASNARISASKLPSDPGLTLAVRTVEVEEREYQPRRNWTLPWAPSAAEPKKTKQRILKGRNLVVYLREVPVFYWPYVQTDPENPMGPLEKISFNYNGIFGFQLFTTWNAYDLFGIEPIPGTRWRLMIDGMTERGPALGTEYDYAGQDLFGIPSRFVGLIKGYGIYDTGEDIIGRNRGEGFYVPPPPGVLVPTDHPDFRGRFLHRLNVQDMPQGFSLLTQQAFLSDPNFLEQFFVREYREDPNQETYIYVKQHKEIFSWSILAQQRTRDWVTETSWLPRADANLIGQKFFNLFTYNLDASAGYANLGVTDRSPPVFFTNPTTDVPTQTGRFDLFQEVSMPLNLGPLKVAPYLIGDISYYTQDLTGDDRLRLYGGGGVRASLPFSRLYPGAYSELLNVNSIFHKIVFSANYLNAVSDTSLYDLPQLDRWNDDISDQSIRDIYQQQFFFNPTHAAFLTTSPLFDPQIYGLRRGILNNIDTRDDIDVLRLGMRQRWQTKRGFPGAQHIIDWMVLDLQASIFPHANRDNFGELIGIIDYDWIWHIGDRTSLVSNGWFEAVMDGPRVFNIGANFNRPDLTNVYIGYRQIDPINSQAVVLSASTSLNAKYALTASSAYDFGIDNQSNAIMLSRIGTDLTISLGFAYNSILDTVSVNFAITPNLMRSLGPVAPGTALGPPLAGR